MSLTIGSLFSGIGGLELGLERAGLGPVVWQVEQSEYCRAVLAKHWPGAQRFDDVRTVGAHNLKNVDVVCGGFPCQDISSAGRKVGIRGDRSGLWFEYARVVRELRPRYVVVENVSRLLADGMGDVLGELATLGYDAEWSGISACSVGAPHMRERVFVVAYPASARLESGGVRSGNAERVAQPHVDRSATFWPRPDVPPVRGMAHGIPRRSHRNHALGNAVVPQVAEIVGRVVLALEVERMRGAA